jgi:hypothetical protein
MDFLTFVSEVGFPIAGALAAGVFIFIILKFILATVTGSVNGLKNIIQALDNRVQTMNNDLVKIDTLLSHVSKVRPNVDRLAANEGKEDARKRLDDHVELAEAIKSFGFPIVAAFGLGYFVYLRLEVGDQGDQARAGRGQQDPDRTDRQDTYAGQRHDTSDPWCWSKLNMILDEHKEKPKKK